jgi:hypothetical protein
LLDGLISTGTSKSYLRDGGQWISKNSKPEDSIISNQVLVYHYSGIRMDQRERAKMLDFANMLAQGEVLDSYLKDVRHIAIRTKHVPPDTLLRLEKALQNHATNVFSSSDKEQLIIYSKPE